MSIHGIGETTAAKILKAREECGGYLTPQTLRDKLPHLARVIPVEKIFTFSPRESQEEDHEYDLQLEENPSNADEHTSALKEHIGSDKASIEGTLAHGEPVNVNSVLPSTTGARSKRSEIPLDIQTDFFESLSSNIMQMVTASREQDRRTIDSLTQSMNQLQNLVQQQKLEDGSRYEALIKESANERRQLREEIENLKNQKVHQQPFASRFSDPPFTDTPHMFPKPAGTGMYHIPLQRAQTPAANGAFPAFPAASIASPCTKTGRYAFLPQPPPPAFPTYEYNQVQIAMEYDKKIKELEKEKEEKLRSFTFRPELSAVSGRKFKGRVPKAKRESTPLASGHYDYASDVNDDARSESEYECRYDEVGFLPRKIDERSVNGVYHPRDRHSNSKSSYRPPLNRSTNSAQPNTATSSLPILPWYDGSGHWKSFYVQFRTYSQLKSWDEQEKLDNLCLCLKDKALDYYVIQTESAHLIFAEVVEKMEHRFGKRDLPETLRAQFYQMKQNVDEPVEEWVERVQRLALEAFITLPEDYMDAEIVRRVCQGCADKRTAQYDADRNPKTIDEALQLIKAHLQNCKAIFGSRKAAVHQL